MLSYKQRAGLAIHPLAKRILLLMEAKQSNLAVSADLSDPQAILALAEQVGPYICLLKTHIDIVADFNQKFIDDLTTLAEKYNFLIFEDRKFADIGAIVQQQFGGGIYHINRWAHFINAHALPGPGVITGLKSAKYFIEQGLLLIAEMSSQGHLMTKDYQQAVLAMAGQYLDFVVGFIAQHRLSETPGFLTMTPGIHSETLGDALGQLYITPQAAIIENGSDVIIVGRGIYRADVPQQAASQYRELGWQAYQARLGC